MAHDGCYCGRYGQSPFRCLNQSVGFCLDDGIAGIARIVNGVLRINGDRKEIASQKGFIINLLNIGRDVEIIHI